MKVGDRFNCWEIIEEVRFERFLGKKAGVVKCRCVCGIEKDVKVTLLRLGTSKSCGCKGKTKPVGYKFAYFEVISKPYFKYCKAGKIRGIKQSRFVDCKCICGNIRALKTGEVVRENRKSCGCKQGELSRLKSTKGTLANNGIKKCCRCEIEKSTDEYTPVKNTKDKLLSICNICKKRKMLSKYNISLEDYDKMFKDQDGKCAICKKETKLYVDHCHKDEHVRGLLCNNCNGAIGFMEDKIDNLFNAINYLRNDFEKYNIK